MSPSRTRASLAFLVVVLGALLLGCGCLTEQPATTTSEPVPMSALTYYTEQNPPYNYEENGTLQGISIDLLEAITEKMGQKVSRDQVHLVSWDEGYQAVLTGNRSMIFAIARIPSRETSFKWAGPIPPYTTVLFARPENDIVIHTPQDLSSYRIGTITDDAAVQQLADIGVNKTQLVLVPDVPSLIDLTLDGEIDMWADSEISGRYITEQVTGNASTFQVVYSFPDMPIYFGFSRDVPDATVQAFQQGLDALKAEKDAKGLSTYDRIVQQTRATGLPPALLTFYTEENPPFNYMENGTLKGIAVDLLEAVTEQMGQKVSRDQVHLVPWTEGYQNVLTGPRSVLFTAVRFAEREPLFKWVGPVYPYTDALFAPSDWPVSITGPDDLKGYRIGGVKDDVAVQQILNLGVNESQLVLEADAPTLVRRMENGTIDLWGYQEAAGFYFARQVTGNASSVKVVYRLSTQDGYYVFSRDVPDETIQSFQQALDSIKTDRDSTGMTVYERIVQRYVTP